MLYLHLQASVFSLYLHARLAQHSAHVTISCLRRRRHAIAANRRLLPSRHLTAAERNMALALINIVRLTDTFYWCAGQSGSTDGRIHLEESLKC